MKMLPIYLSMLLLAAACSGTTLEIDIPEQKQQKQQEQGTNQDDITEMMITVSDGTNTVTFNLNDTPAAKDLYAQLPIMVDVENYSNNEKNFYPAKALTKSGNKEGDCPTGTLAYFSPWGNVVMCYGDAPRYSGLYVLGAAESGAEAISKLTGKITVSK